MSPEYQTLLTLALMIGAYYLGNHFGKLKGIELAIVWFEGQGITLTLDEEEEEDE